MVRVTFGWFFVFVYIMFFVDGFLVVCVGFVCFFGLLFEVFLAGGWLC